FGGQADFLSRIALQKLGLNPLKDVTIVQINTIPKRLSTLTTGKVQAAMLNSPNNFRTEKANYYNLVSMQLPYQDVDITSTRAFIRDNPDVVKRYVRSQVEAVHRIKTDRETRIKVLAKYLALQDKEILERSYDDASTEDKLPQKQYPSLEGIKKILEPLAETD